MTERMCNRNQKLLLLRVMTSTSKWSDRVYQEAKQERKSRANGSEMSVSKVKKRQRPRHEN